MTLNVQSTRANKEEYEELAEPYKTEAIGGRIFEKSGNYCTSIQKDIKKNYRLKNMF